MGKIQLEAYILLGQLDIGSFLEVHMLGTYKHAHTQIYTHLKDVVMVKKYFCALILQDCKGKKYGQTWQLHSLPQYSCYESVILIQNKKEKIIIIQFYLKKNNFSIRCKRNSQYPPPHHPRKDIQKINVPNMWRLSETSKQLWKESSNAPIWRKKYHFHN